MKTSAWPCADCWRLRRRSAWPDWWSRMSPATSQCDSFRPEYAGRRPVLLWLMTGAALSCVVSVMGFGLTAARMFTVQAPLCLALVIATTALSAIFIPKWGLLGASMAIALSWAVTAACMGAAAWKAGLLTSRFEAAVLLEAA